MISLILTLIVIGLLLWIVETFVPMDASIARILRVVVIICVVVWLLQVFGFGVMDVPIPRYHGALR